MCGLLIMLSAHVYVTIFAYATFYVIEMSTPMNSVFFLLKNL